jgi:ABC-type sugar transport system ATPase subunit
VATIRLEELCKTYPNGVEAVRGVDLEIADGELLVLVGPSGCGKSTVLRLVAGLESPTRGRVGIDGRDVTNCTPAERDVAMVFQSYALYPHKSVRDNLAFGLRMRRLERAEVERRVARVARRLDLEAVLERRPGQLSGGQRQRVALGRALVREPLAFLLDEPLSNLDARLRVETRTELARLHRELGATMIHVTHDQEEAMTLGDRVAVLREGRLEQVGAPLEVYGRPATTFVADFIGSPSMNWLDGRLGQRAGRALLECAGLELELERPAAEGAERPVRVGIRPHDLRLVEPERGAWRARVELLQMLGSSRIVDALVPGGPRLRACDAGSRPLRLDEEVGLEVPPGAPHLFDPDSGTRLD